MSRLVEEVVKALKYSLKLKRFWVDSKVVIYWLTSQSSRFIPFVATWIQGFQVSHGNVKEELRYIPSKLNPADHLTIPVEALKPWHQGPDFLKQPESSWPKFDDELETDSEILEKPKPKVKKYRRVKGVHAVQTETSKSKDFGTRLAEKLSSWMDSLEIVALSKIVLRQKTFSFVEESSVNVVEELGSAKQIVIKLCQASLYEDLEKTRREYFKHDIRVNAFGVLQSGGRLDQSNLLDELKYPVILPARSQLVHLLAQHCHRRFKHQGYRIIIANLRLEGILIVGGRKLLKSVAARCFFCRTRRRKLLQQRMGELPSFRIQPKLAPFTSVAMDFSGHLKVKQSRNVAVNGSVLIITCATTRCIHLELCLTQDTNSFLTAWRRFATCRGVHPSLVFSDCGGAFIGAEKPIREWIEEWDKDLIKRYLAKSGTKFEWTYNVPSASHMNGVVESLINSVRKALDASVFNYTYTQLTYEQWATNFQR
ncbi:PREDICTED: uncharacterized protein LOC107334477 [Paramuricea clavata]|uniref:PREDICTED: uncharacterized protein LOC107334477 n=1 Tax=Paramuricea clavata TaxID=317549 RepID=A0A6S7JAX2_PARCT|nr:PREDICTED: uncharacterized protein LOC107334477 [Paramuricea clavata]